MPRGWGTPVSSSKHQHSHLEPHSHQAGWESCSQHQHPTRPQRPLTAAAHHPALPEAAFVPDLPKRRQKEDTRALTAQQKRILSHFCLSGAHPSHKTRHPDEDCQKKKGRTWLCPLMNVKALKLSIPFSSSVSAISNIYTSHNKS